MDWRALQDGLSAWFAQASGVDIYGLAWEGDSELYRAFPQAELSLQKHAAEDGTDEIRWDVDPDGLLVPTAIGNRLVTLRIRLQSRDARGPEKAFAILDRVRTRLALPGALEAFDALDVTVRDTEPTQDMGLAGEQGELSVAVLAIDLAYTAEERAEDQAAPPIESVQIGGTVQDQTASITVPDQIIP